MRDVAKTMKSDLETALKEYDDDSANFSHFLHLVVGETIDERERYCSLVHTYTDTNACTYTRARTNTYIHT